MCAPIPTWSSTSTVQKEMNNLSRFPRIFIGNWGTACYSRGWFYPATDSSSSGWIRVVANSCSGSWIRVTADFILRLTRAPAPGYDLRLIPSCSWLWVAADSSSGGWIRLKADYILRLTISYGWLEFQSSIRVTADSILRLTTSCGWFYLGADSSPPARLNLHLTYTLKNQVN